MDEKVMVEVCVPAAMRCFDVVLPSTFSIAQIKECLLPMLQECTHGAFVFGKKTAFYLTRGNANLLDDQLVNEIGIQNGDEIIIW